MSRVRSRIGAIPPGGRFIVSEGPQIRPESDIYTVLAAIATIIVVAATVFLCIRSNQLFGLWHPFGGA
jgi:hypothetical protein